MKKKTAGILILVFLLALSLAGCRNGETKSWVPGMPLDKDDIKIGVIFLDQAGSGWSYAHDMGISEAARKFELKDDQIIRKFNINDAEFFMIEHAISSAVAAGANVIIATSWGFMDACEQLAKEYPNVIFAHASGYKYNETNFTNYFGRLYEARYLAGIVAGLRTRTNKIGFIAAQDSSNSEVTGGLNAFAMGAESVNPDAGVYVRITHSWYDPAGERRAAERLIAEGCDVIAQHSDTAEPQLAAADAGVWGIGSNVQMSLAAPDTVITSVLWNWDIYYSYLIGSIIDGSFETTPYLGDLAGGMLDITPLNPALKAPGSDEAVALAREQIYGGFNIFSGVIETNDGRIFGSEETSLSDEDIRNNINWYYRNITVIE